MINQKITLRVTSNLLNKSDSVSRKQLKSLESKNLIQWHGSSKNDPTQYYSISI